MLVDDLKRKLLDSFKDGQNWHYMVEYIAEEDQKLLDVVAYLMAQTWKDVAAGVWLDRVGAIVGIRRPGNEEVERVFRCRGSSTPRYDPLHGFGSSNPLMGGFLSGRNGVPAPGLLGDEAYLTLINAKIFGTCGDGSTPGLARFVQNAFDGLTCTITADNRVIEMEISGDFDLQQRRYIGRFAPVVAGVELRITNWPEL